MGWINRQALAETGETDYDLEPLRRMKRRQPSSSRSKKELQSAFEKGPA